MVVSLTPVRGRVDPIIALRRCAFLLERRAESTYRVEAFRGAVQTVQDLTSTALAEAAATGTLTDLPGIGKSTAGVISEALQGRLPIYLKKLQDSGGGPLIEGGESYFGALKGDLHTHSNWSDGGSPIYEMALTGIELGHEYMVLTDHSPRLSIANGLSAQRLTEQLAEVATINEAMGSRMRLLTGIEVDILDDGELDQTDDMLNKLDVVVASVHSKLKMDSLGMTRRMLGAVRNEHTNVLGHCTGRLVTGGRGTRPQSKFDARRVFEACAEHNVAVEINARPEREDPPDELITLATDIGCLFAIDSDAHAPGQLEMKAYGCARAERLRIDLDMIVNTWDCARLLDWAAT